MRERAKENTLWSKSTRRAEQNSPAVLPRAHHLPNVPQLGGLVLAVADEVQPVTLRVDVRDALAVPWQDAHWLGQGTARVDPRSAGAAAAATAVWRGGGGGGGGAKQTAIPHLQGMGGREQQMNRGCHLKVGATASVLTGKQ